MGCCAGLKNDNIFDKEYIVNLGPKEIDDLLESDRDFYKNSEKKKYRKSTSKTAETNAESPKKRKKSGNFHNQRIKDIARNLRLIADEEVKNIRKFFVVE